MRTPVRVALGSLAARFAGDAAPLILDESALRVRYRALDAWPADAELALRVLGWALGPGFALAGFREALNGGALPDFDAAARCLNLGDVPTLIALSGVARTGFLNASVVVRAGLDPEVLYWPLGLTDCVGATMLGTDP